MAHGGDGDDDDIGAQAWPGFVDILSSVLIMFVFFLMITAVALSIHVMVFKARMEAQAKKKIDEQIQSQLHIAEKGLEKENEQLKIRIAELEEQVSGPQQAVNTQLADMTETKVQSSRVDQAARVMYVFFPPSAVTLEDKTLGDVRNFFAANANLKSVSITASRRVNDKSDVVARKIAVSRILNVRNAALDSKVAAVSISATLVEGDPIDGTLDWVKIELR